MGKELDLEIVRLRANAIKEGKPVPPLHSEMSQNGKYKAYFAFYGSDLPPLVRAAVQMAQAKAATKESVKADIKDEADH